MSNPADSIGSPKSPAMTARDRSTILVADDDAVIRGNLRVLLAGEGYRVLEASNGVEAEKLLGDKALALVLLDLRMPGRDGMDLLRDHTDLLEDLPVIVITALGGSSVAIEAMKLGAFDYITKPFDLDEVIFTVRRALAQKALVAQVQALSAAELESSNDKADDELVGRSPQMFQVFKTIGRVAAASEAVLILGESGTGKELVASAIHRNSGRAGRPFIKVNCAALSSTLLESELFGHEKGAFTGAVARRAGRFEQAHEGTLFLDEVGDLDIDLQAKLLRVLQTGQFERVGGNESLQVDVRIISATHHNLPSMIAEGRYREDLHYRLNVVAVELPPLRSRRDDIPILAEHFIRRLALKYKWAHLGLAPEAVTWLSNQDWPGNVRQLQNVLARVAILSRGRMILAEDFGPFIPPVSAVPETNSGATMSLKEMLAETERRAILHALEQTSWNRTKASKLLGISRRQLFDKIHQYDLRRQ
jgi:DNA-binding NtrC family response regulator